MDPPYENSISVLGRDLLLVDVGGGAETHLAEVADGPGWSARHEGNEGAPLVGRWSDSTLCGRTWNRMAAGADELLPLWRDPAFAPTCRGCLRILDSWFPTADTPSGVWLLAAVAAEEVTRFSSTYVTGVPVEHVEATRAAIRKVLRSNGFGSSTRVVEGVVHVWSDDAYEAIDPAEIRASVTSAIERMTTVVDTAPDRDRDPDSTPGPNDWHTWVIE